jgi:peptide/nickel transport system permease protein
MLGYLARRLLMTIPTLLLVAIGVFTLVRLIPGDPVQVMLGDSADPAQIAQMRAQLGLDQSIPLQFVHWLARLLIGDFGHSITNNLDVLPLILDRFQVSAVIVLVDLSVVGGATLLLSIPSFWLGLLLLILFGLKLNWLPVIGYVPFSENFGQAALFMMLPIITLAMVETGVLTRMARAASIEVLRLEYVTHARAKGVPEWLVLGRHVLPNAFAPTWTLIGLVLGHLLGGIAVIETVFTLPGLGRLLVDSIFARDYPVVQGCLLFTAVIYVVVNLIVDLCYPLFDPRVAVA